MKKKYSLLVGTILTLILFTGCTTNTGPKVIKIQETTYPKGISVFINSSKVRNNIEISDARISFAKNKKQIQFIVNNTSSDTYNLILDSEWFDERNTKISSYPRPSRIHLNTESSKRIVLNAPNYTAKTVLIVVKCDTNCIEK
ncbi:MAG TPA: DUF1425 domain-containing protein [Crocinitomix sp.]|nr:DUF1425 domain-containing protein [Crocinitomix sp.]